MKPVRSNRIVALLAAFVMMFAATGLNAQFRYGPAAGVDITNLKFKQNLFEVDKSVGFSAGLMAEMMFPGIGFGIDFGLLYEQRGAKLYMSDKELWDWQKIGDPRCRLHYVNIPFHLRYKYTRMNGFEDYMAPFAFVGPSFGFLAGHNDIRALNYAAGEVGIDFGLGFELFRHFQISASYNIGMTYALKTKVLTDFSAKNRTWLVKAAWLF